MDEDNDDQWLYGEEATAEKPASNEEINDKSDDIFHEKENDPHDDFINPPVPAEENISLEPPIIKPPGVTDFEDSSVVPGEEELLVPLDPPIIAAEALEPVDSNEQIPSDGRLLVNGQANENGELQEKPTERKLSEGEDDDDDDDNINVVIGDIRTTPSYNSNLHIKRGNLLTLTKQTGKFAVDDFETVGVINGVAAHEFNLDNLEDKPWRKPGADITDYFNYGFNEDTWRAYCERQKRMRVHESGSGLIPMNQQPNLGIIPNMAIPPPNMSIPPPGMNNSLDGSGNINVIGGPNTRRSGDPFAKENTIQVMTADRREYSKKSFTPDMSVPPPIVPPPFGTMPPGIPPPFPPMGQYGPPPGEYFPPEMDPYYHPYEPPGPHQDPNWGGPNWNPNMDVKNMIPLGSNDPQRSINGSSDSKSNDAGGSSGVKIKTEPEERDGNYDHDRERRDYDRDRERESRHRDRSHRHRSRSRSHERRSRKHKSRSRSPGYRSHKKKKSKKSERSKSESD